MHGIVFLMLPWKRLVNTQMIFLLLLFFLGGGGG